MNLKSVLLLLFIGYSAHVAATEGAGAGTEEIKYPYGLSFVGHTWTPDPKPSPLMVRVERADGSPVAIIIGSEHDVPLTNLDATFLFDIVRLRNEKGINFFFETIAKQKCNCSTLAYVRGVLELIRAAREEFYGKKHSLSGSYEAVVDAIDSLEAVKINGIDVPCVAVQKWGIAPPFFKGIQGMLKEYSLDVIKNFLLRLEGLLPFELDMSTENLLGFLGIECFGLESMVSRLQSGSEDFLGEFNAEETFLRLHKAFSSLYLGAFERYNYPNYVDLEKDLSNEEEKELNEAMPRNKQMLQVFLRALEGHLEGKSLMPIAMVGSFHLVGTGSFLPSLVRWVEGKELLVKIKESYGGWRIAPLESFADPAQAISMEEFETWKSMHPAEDDVLPGASATDPASDPVSVPTVAPVAGAGSGASAEGSMGKADIPPMRRSVFESPIDFSRPYVSEALQTIVLGNVTFAFIKRGLGGLSSKEARLLQSYDIVYARTPEYLQGLREALASSLVTATPPAKRRFGAEFHWGKFILSEPYMRSFSLDPANEYFQDRGKHYTLAAYFFLDPTDPIIEVETYNVTLAFELAFEGTPKKARSLSPDNIHREVNARETAVQCAALHPLWEKAEKNYDYSPALATSIASLFVPDAERRGDLSLPIYAQNHVGRITSVPKEFYFRELEDLYRALVPDLPVVEEGKRALVLLPAFLLPYAQQKYLQPPSYRLYEWGF